MSTPRCARTSLLALAVVIAVSSAAGADEIYATGPGCGGFLCIGFDVFADQSQALRFTPGSDFTLDQLQLWFMNNDFSGQFHEEVVITIEGDLFDGGSCHTPDGVVLDEMRFNVTAVGWDPVLEIIDSVSRPLLTAGTNYWVVAKSSSPPGVDPVWVIADNFNGFMSASVFGSPDEWQCGGDGAVAGAVILGDRVGSDYSLSLSPSPLVAGEEATLTISGAEPSTTTYVALSLSGVGETFLPALNVTLELAGPLKAAPTLTTDASGFAEVTFTVPPGSGGNSLWIQSAQLDKRSDLVETTIE